MQLFDLFSDQSVIIVVVITGGLVIVVIAMTITVVSAVACFLVKKRKQRNSSDYIYTTNLTYNIRSGRTGIKDENEGNSDSHQPSTIPYYDYIEPPNPLRPGSMERVLSSSGSNDSMEQNRAYRSYQVAHLHTVSGSSHSMV